MAGTECCGTGELTCEERYVISEEEACAAAECHPSGSVQQHMADFFSPDWAVDLGQFGRQVNEYLICREPCYLGNNAEKVCGPECGEDCGGCTWNVTGCDDPEQCNTYTHGWNYVALARAAEFSGSLKYIPYATELFGDKTVEDLVAEPEAVIYVYDKDQTADNQSCDPCADQVIGAFVPVPAATFVSAVMGDAEHWATFTLGHEGTSVIPVADEDVGIFETHANALTGAIEVISASVSAAVGPDGNDEDWRIYDVDSDVTLVTFTVTNNAASPLAVGVISQSFTFAAPNRYAVEPTTVGATTPAEGVALTITGRFTGVFTP